MKRMKISSYVVIGAAVSLFFASGLMVPHAHALVTESNINAEVRNPPQQVFAGGLMVPHGNSTVTERDFHAEIRDAQPPAGALHRVAEGVYSPIEAIVLAALAAPSVVEGKFGFTVRNVGQMGDGTILLNSELNYREQINVTVRLSQRLASYLQRTYGKDWVNDIVGKEIEVVGEAKRLPIYFRCNNQRTESYYYQTQIEVKRPEHFVIL